MHFSREIVAIAGAESNFAAVAPKATGKHCELQLGGTLTQLGTQNMTCYESNCGSIYAGLSSLLAHAGTQGEPSTRVRFPGLGLGCACYAFGAIFRGFL